METAARIEIGACIAPAYWDLWRDVMARRHGEYWLKGGRGSAKSTFCGFALLAGLLADPLANAIVYRKVAGTLRQSVYEQLIWCIERLGLRPWFRLRLSPLEITYAPTGQRILFRGADDPTKSKSIKLSRGYFAYLWLEELTEFSGMEDVRSIQASVIRGAGRACTLMSYNPPVSARSWVNAEALKPVAGRRIHESDYRMIPPAWLGESFLAQAEALRASNERAYRHMYLGEVTGTGGQVFDNLELRPVRPEEQAALEKFFTGLDFGFAADPDALVRWGWNPRTRKIYGAGEFYGIRNSIDVLARQCQALAGREAVRCDSADPRMIAELQARGVNAVAVKKGPGSREHGFRWLQELGGIVIDPARMPNAAREFAAYEYRQDKDGNFLSEYPDGNDHTLDGSRYALEPVIARKTLRTLEKGRLGL